MAESLETPLDSADFVQRMWRENILTVTACEDVLVVFGEIVLDNELRMRWNRIRKLLRHFVDHEFEPQLFSLLGI